jgi:DUF1680 family protein
MIAEKYMTPKYQSLPYGSTCLQESVFKRRAEINRQYMLSLSSKNLLQNHYLTAGLWGPDHHPQDCHWGWESPTCQIRGHFLGHWLSAAANYFAMTKDYELKGKADWIVSEIARCQKENGGEWAGSVPEQYLDWLVQGKKVWAPQYVLHKTLMGLLNAYSLTGNEQALDVVIKWSRWFHRWVGQFGRGQWDDILDNETGGMLEIWAELYHITGKQEHLDLMMRYDRPRLFHRLIAGEDVLTNKHANTTIPEILGAARAYEVTGEFYWREVVDAYWRLAVTERGYYCTGGQTCEECWTPPGQLATRLSNDNQEHCTVFNMMRLAEFLWRWTGDAKLADYWELNLYNGILSQQNPRTGMVCYYLPMEAGSVKKWGTPTETFWCCHGSLVQAHSDYGRHVWYEDQEGLVLTQFIPTETNWRRNGVLIKLILDDRDSMGHNFLSIQDSFPCEQDYFRYDRDVWDLKIDCDSPMEFTLKIRIPGWVKGEPLIEINGIKESFQVNSSSSCEIHRIWQKDKIHFVFPKSLQLVPLPDRQDLAAFRNGPVVLAGLCPSEKTLRGDGNKPETFLTPSFEYKRIHRNDRGPHYRTVGQEEAIKFIPLYEVEDEQYTLYFSIKND